MAYPSTTLATLNPTLSSFLEYDTAVEMGYIGSTVYPITEVTLGTDSFGVKAIEEIKKQIKDNTRAPGSGYERDTSSFTTKTYTTVERGNEDKVDDHDARRYARYFDAMKVGTMRVVTKIHDAAEKRVADSLMDTTVYTGSLAQSLGNGQWSAANSTPIVDVEAAVQKVWANSGLHANAIVMNWQTFRTLRNHADIVARISSSGAGDKATATRVTLQQLSEVFNLRVLVGGAIQNTAAPGASASIANIWPKHVSVCKIATTQDMAEPCVGRTFHWGEDGSLPSGRIEHYREEKIRAEIIRGRQETHEMRIYNEAACIIASVIA